MLTFSVEESRFVSSIWTVQVRIVLWLLWSRLMPLATSRLIFHSSLTFLSKEIQKYVKVKGYLICTKLLWRWYLMSWTNRSKNELSKQGQVLFHSSLVRQWIFLQNWCHACLRTKIRQNSSLRIAPWHCSSDSKVSSPVRFWRDLRKWYMLCQIRGVSLEYGVTAILNRKWAPILLIHFTHYDLTAFPLCACALNHSLKTIAM